MLHTKYQGSRASDFRQEVLSFLLGLAIADKKSFTNIDIEKLVTPPGGHIFKTAINLNNIDRGCHRNHLCVILLKSDQKFLTRFRVFPFG